jgi:hypothetical protein
LANFAKFSKGIHANESLLGASSSQERLNIKALYNEPINALKANTMGGLGVTEWAPNTQTAFSMPLVVMYDHLFGIVANPSRDEGEMDLSLRLVTRNASLTFPHDALESRLISDTLYTPTRVSEGKGEVRLETQGKYGVEARIDFPNLDGVDIGTYHLTQEDVNARLKLLTVTRVLPDGQTLQTARYAVPLNSDTALKDFNDTIAKGSMPEELPFTIIPMEVTTPYIDLTTHELVLKNTGNMFRAKRETVDEKAVKESTGSIRSASFK